MTQKPQRKSKIIRINLNPEKEAPTGGQEKIMAYLSQDIYPPEEGALVNIALCEVANPENKWGTAGFLYQGIWYAAVSPERGFLSVTETLQVTGWQPIPQP